MSEFSVPATVSGSCTAHCCSLSDYHGVVKMRITFWIYGKYIQKLTAGYLVYYYINNYSHIAIDPLLIYKLKQLISVALKTY